MEWVSIKDKFPEISYLESDNEDDAYKCYPIQVYSEENPGIQCVAYLVQEQDENNWNFEELSWELYIPGDGGEIISKELEIFTHWMPLPEPPKKHNEYELADVTYFVSLRELPEE